MERYRIENVQRVMLNGRDAKLFNAYEYDQESGDYIFCGQYEAPPETPDHELEGFIDNHA